MELRTLNAKIKSIAKKTASWRDDIQIALTGCAWHAIEHGNVEPCTRLVKAVEGADARAVIHWVEGHMPAVWDKKANAFRQNKTAIKEGKFTYDALTLMSEPWWELATKTKNISSSIDCLEAVRDLIKRLEREATKGEKTIEHIEVIDALKITAAKFGEMAQA
jgi:hypothetical protein